jgi:hypothetical protein
VNKPLVFKGVYALVHEMAEETQRLFPEAAKLHGAAALMAKELREFETEINRPAYARSRTRMVNSLARIISMAFCVAEELGS